MPARRTRIVASDQYDEYDARVRVPKGERLARSRDTPGAHRGFTHSGERKMEHAEIFLKGESEQGEPESNQGPPYVIINEPALASRTREQEELDELLRVLVMLGLTRAAEIASPYVKRWWNGQALPFVKATWKGLRARRMADHQARLDEPGAVHSHSGAAR
jgi:hypothetical protein